jgi:hypothetical protein
MVSVRGWGRGLVVALDVPAYFKHRALIKCDIEPKSVERLIDH